MFTIASAVMRKDTTSDQIYEEFLTVKANLAKQGWEPYGEIVYYINAVSQAMIKGTINKEALAFELEKDQRYGSTQPRILEFRFGGEGVFGKYYDVHNCI